MWTFSFFANSVLFGAGLAMDAVSVSLANGMSNAGLPRSKGVLTAGTFGFFQMLMPMIGWAAVHFVEEYFDSFRRWTPWIALILLCFLGGKMIVESFSKKESEKSSFTFRALLLEGVATSIDALSVGFTIDSLPWYQALTESCIIGAVTFGLCCAAVRLGKFAGAKLQNKARLVGGLILIAVGIEIFVKNWFFAG